MENFVNKKHKVLIIKVGYSETLDSEISNVTSYGDVLRTTVLLNLYKNDHVTWLVDENAFPILKNNPLIDRTLIYNLSSVLQLQSEHFDTVINLEKVPGICALADSITAWRRYGFRFDVKKGVAEAYQGTEKALGLCHSEKVKKKHKRCWQEHLFEMVGAQWQKEEYVFGYEPEVVDSFDFGFNYKVGSKWPSKSWGQENWKELETKIGDQYTISWQEGLENMEEYFAWIARCKVLVTNDSLGLHLALALNKRVVALFCSTNPYETFLYGRGEALYKGGSCECMPCYKPHCIQEEKSCDVDIDSVYYAALKQINEVV